MRLIDWFKESNRWKHFVGGALWCTIMFIFSIVTTKVLVPTFWIAQLSTLGVACALEFKDKEHGSEADIVDIYATMLGSLFMGLILSGVYLILK